MTREEEIRVRLEKATPGPYPDDLQELQDTLHKAALDDRDPEDTGAYFIECDIRPADAEFFSHSWADVSYLLERVGELERENAELRKRLED